MQGQAPTYDSTERAGTPTSRLSPAVPEFIESLVDIENEEAFLAAQLEAERQALAVAMAESLDEDKARKAAERPLEEWERQELTDRYKASSILREHPHGAVALEGACRKDFIACLEFERQALKWYPGRGTEAFFAQAAKKAAGYALSVKFFSRANQARNAGRGATTRSKSAEKPTSFSEADTLPFTRALSKQVNSAKDTVYGMPNAAIPDIFRNIEESEEDSDVEFLEERTPAKKIKAIDLC